MNALLLIAHGSRRAESNDEIRDLTARIRCDAARFALVEHAFLEMAEPSISATGSALVAAGATDITVLPYFLAAGNHIHTDIPAEISALQTRHPAARFTLAAHLGAATGMAELIRAHLDDA